MGVVASVAAQPAPSSTQWLCSPNVQNDPCDLPPDTTDLGTGTVTTPPVVPESAKPVDCFYVYPTVSNQVSLNADPVASPEVKSIASFQAARFGSICRMYVPIYRQVPLLGLAPVLFGQYNAPVQPAYDDVLAAWNDYLAHENNGRGVIFIGHSQGTLMLRKLIREQIDPKPELRKKVVGAFLMGGNVTTAEGSTTGGDFANIPLCTRPRQAGCVVAYSTNIVAPPVSLFGNTDLDLPSSSWGLPRGPGFEIACTDPAVLSGNSEPVGATVPSTPYSFGILSILLDYTTIPDGPITSASTYTTSKGRGVGECQDVNGIRQYHVTFTVPQAVNEIPLFDTHLLDVNFGIDRLVDIARGQIGAWQGGA